MQLTDSQCVHAHIRSYRGSNITQFYQQSLNSYNSRKNGADDNLAINARIITPFFNLLFRIYNITYFIRNVFASQLNAIKCN